MASEGSLRAVAVYCGSSLGNEQAFRAAGISVGRTLAAHQRPLVYGGGSKGIMGIVSGAVLEGGGHVIGVVPAAMLAAGGEGDKTAITTDRDEHGAPVVVEERERVQIIVVDSMHERKVEMAKRACGFIGFPGGFGTFEEVFEAITWTQLGIHNKPIVLINVLGFFEPVRTLIRDSIRQGFIPAANENIVLFVDGPADLAEHAAFDWGGAALVLIEGWKGVSVGYYKWDQPAKDGRDALALS